MDGQKQDGKNSSRELTRSLVKADKMLQIAFMLPTAVLVGWLIGAGLDHWLHQHWIYLAGIFLGIGAGFVEIFRLMRELEGEIDTKKPGKGSEESEAEGPANDEDGKIHKEQP